MSQRDSSKAVQRSEHTKWPGRSIYGRNREADLSDRHGLDGTQGVSFVGLKEPLRMLLPGKSALRSSIVLPLTSGPWSCFVEGAAEKGENKPVFFTLSPHASDIRRNEYLKHYLNILNSFRSKENSSFQCDVKFQGIKYFHVSNLNDRIRHFISTNWQGME